MPYGLTVVMLIVCPACFGFGAAALLHLLIRKALVGQSWATVFTIMGWFFGNGAAVVATILPRDPEIVFGVPHTAGAVLLSYIGGFGVTVGLNVIFAAPEMLVALREVLGNKHVEVLLMVLRYEHSFEEVAERLGITVGEAQRLFLEAHKIIGCLGARYFKQHSLESNIPRTTVNVSRAP